METYMGLTIDGYFDSEQIPLDDYVCLAINPQGKEKFYVVLLESEYTALIDKPTFQELISRTAFRLSWANSTYKNLPVEWIEDTWNRRTHEINSLITSNILIFLYSFYPLAETTSSDKFAALADALINLVTTLIEQSNNLKEWTHKTAIAWMRKLLEEQASQTYAESLTLQEWKEINVAYQTHTTSRQLRKHTIGSLAAYVQKLTKEFIKEVREDYAKFEHPDKDQTYEAFKDFIKQKTKKFLAITRKQSITLPATDQNPLFNRAVAMVPSGAPMISGTMALMSKWQPNNDGEPRYVKRFSKGRIEHFIELTHSTRDQLTELAKLSAWEIVQSFDVYTAKLQLLIAVHAIQKREPWKQEFAIKGTDCIKVLNLNKRNDWSKSRKLNFILEKMSALSHLGVYIEWHQDKLNLCTEASKMWDFRIITFYKNNTKQELSEIIIEVRAGLWTKSFLNREGTESRTAVFQYGYLAQKILEIDHYHHPFAAKAMIYLTLQTQTETFRVKTLLENIEGKECITESQQDREKRSNLKKQFDDFLMIANDLGCFIEYDEESYPEDIRPDFATKTYRNRHEKGYFENWVQAKVTISLPEPIPMLLEKNKETNLKKRITKPLLTLPTGNFIRQAREAKGWSTTQLAQKLGVSKMAISSWESGKRKINPENAKSLKEILGIT